MCKILNFPAHEEKSETILQEDGTAIFLDGATRETLSPEGQRVLQELIDSL